MKRYKMMKKRIIIVSVAAVILLAAGIAALFIFTGGKAETSEPGIIESVSPSGEITASPKEKVKIMVVAMAQAQVTVRVGTQRFTAQKCDSSAQGFTAFTATVKMPDTLEEMQSLGTVYVVASCNGESQFMHGAKIKPVAAQTTQKPTQTTTIPAGNYVPDLPDDAYSYSQVPTQPTTSLRGPETGYISPGIGANAAFTGTQMCVVTVPYADARPLIAGDDTYVPYYTPLVAGTMDFVTAQSEAYNREDEEMVYFYELSSGRKVKRSDVQLMDNPGLGDNSLRVISSSASAGTLTFRLSTDWKVPYDFTYGPQNYFSAYNKKFNVSSFTANYIRLDFYHTTGVIGEVDTSGSNVVSSAQWSVSAAEKKVSLTLPLKKTGQFYGCSVEYDSSGYMVVTIHNKPSALSGSVILLDPGHGGNDPGAMGIGSAVREKDVNYAIAYYTKLALEQKGATVYMTRGGDTTLSLEDRKAICRGVKPDLFLAIHCNGSENPANIGTSAYYYKPYSQPLAKNVYEELLSVFKNNLYPGRTDIYDALADGTIYYPFSVTRIEDCPSVLIEVGYMTNDEECYKLIDAGNEQLFAAAIARGVERTLS
ncbi:MAG: N-acetylmuramoyl-L-alanine amidase [Oscillospiraceae bacterium]|nr:N-acetylmuramoyl-L-alanine amidase [Oscillospiraceae bacterium]